LFLLNIFRFSLRRSLESVWVDMLELLKDTSLIAFFFARASWFYNDPTIEFCCYKYYAFTL